MRIELIGDAVAILTTISLLPQVIKVWQTRGISGVDRAAGTDACFFDVLDYPQGRYP
jgi:uncharacterized protein with PQ loop repeat